MHDKMFASVKSIFWNEVSFHIVRVRFGCFFTRSLNTNNVDMTAASRTNADAIMIMDMIFGENLFECAVLTKQFPILEIWDAEQRLRLLRKLFS
ncbi:hypothetical protein HanRHA438_Chr13g0606811 [Helianthus annuus]|nr:hypothetical protein HanIR_Chr13g0648511 [Helianthus annuus]KAJ0858937.1 hypothetical protein HanRHA438_Chr13g0606811 [Helianthus annuus]